MFERQQPDYVRQKVFISLTVQSKPLNLNSLPHTIRFLHWKTARTHEKGSKYHICSVRNIRQRKKLKHSVNRSTVHVTPDGRLVAEIAGLNPADGMVFRLLCLL